MVVVSIHTTTTIMVLATPMEVERIIVTTTGPLVSTIAIHVGEATIPGSVTTTIA